MQKNSNNLYKANQIKEKNQISKAVAEDLGQTQLTKMPTV